MRLHVKDVFDRTDWALVGGFTLLYVIACCVILSMTGCIAVMADRVEMKDPKQPYSAAAPIGPPDPESTGAETPDCKER